MTDNSYTADAINQLAGLLSGAIQAQAMRPQKTSVYTTSSSTTTPYALADMVANRDRIGQATRNLNDALRARESLGYTLANSLANIPQQQGYGSWLTDFARSLGGAWGAPTTMAMDRAQKQYENEMNDLATILAYDKAMGDTTTQKQSQVVGYTPMEYGTAGGNVGGRGNSTGKSIGGIDFSGFQRSVGYDPVKNKIDFTMLDRMAINLPENTLGGAATKAIVSEMADTEKTTPQLQQLYSDVSDNIVKGAMLKFIEQAGGVRVADTPEEQAKIIGPLVNYNSMRPDDLYAAIDRSRNAFVALALPKFRVAGYDVTEDDMKNLYNSAFTVPQGMEKEGMYNISNADKYAPKMFNMPEKGSEESQAKKEDINALWDLIP